MPEEVARGKISGIITGHNFKIDHKFYPSEFR